MGHSNATTKQQRGRNPNRWNPVHEDQMQYKQTTPRCCLLDCPQPILPSDCLQATISGPKGGLQAGRENVTNWVHERRKEKKRGVMLKGLTGSFVLTVKSVGTKVIMASVYISALSALFARLDCACAATRGVSNLEGSLLHDEVWRLWLADQVGGIG